MSWFSNVTRNREECCHMSQENSILQLLKSYLWILPGFSTAENIKQSLRLWMVEMEMYFAWFFVRKKYLVFDIPYDKQVTALPFVLISHSSVLGKTLCLGNSIVS